MAVAPHGQRRAFARRRIETSDRPSRRFDQADATHAAETDLAVEEQEVEFWRRSAEACQDGVRLAAMMGLVVEEVVERREPVPARSARARMRAYSGTSQRAPPRRARRHRRSVACPRSGGRRRARRSPRRESHPADGAEPALRGTGRAQRRSVTSRWFSVPCRLLKKHNRDRRGTGRPAGLLRRALELVVGPGVVAGQHAVPGRHGFAPDPSTCTIGNSASRAA